VKRVSSRRWSLATQELRRFYWGLIPEVLPPVDQHDRMFANKNGGNWRVPYPLFTVGLSHQNTDSGDVYLLQIVVATDWFERGQKLVSQ
jgi:hypothetical protein